MNAIALAVVTSPADPLELLADELLATHRITQQALPPMLAQVMADDDLRHAALVKLIEGECRRTIEARLAYRHQQHKRKTGGGPIGIERAGNLAGHAAAVAASLMEDFRLPSGRKLGDATRADLEAAMQAYRSQASDAEVKHRWLRLVQQSLPHGKQVRDVLTDARVAELRDEARKAEQ